MKSFGSVFGPQTKKALPCRCPFHLTHLAFLPSDHRPRAAALCHSILIHLSHLVRLMLSMACSISLRHTALSACAASSLGSIFTTYGLPEHKLSSPGC